MTDLTFVNVTGQPVIITISFNKIVKIATMQGGIPMYSTLEGLKFNPSGIVKEFPDLEGKPIEEIQREALKRFREHLENKKTEREVIEYLKEDLGKHGYKMILIQKKGFRPQRAK